MNNRSDVARLKRALAEGETVILSTGATATTRRAYPAGYSGEIEILLDGAEETERVAGLELPNETPEPAPETAADSQLDSGHTREESHRMRD